MNINIDLDEILLYCNAFILKSQNLPYTGRTKKKFPMNNV